jgi:hypothetical protein
MLRRSITVVALTLLAGCQDYNFNPVGKCVIQPGSSRIQLSGVSTADILFVVDDSGSMQPEQASLADNFTAFIDALAQTEAERAQNALQPLEFHIAITTSSVFEGNQTNVACQGQPLTCNLTNGLFPDEQFTPVSYACTQQGTPCVELSQNYHAFGGCIAGVAAAGTRYPQGDFVAAGANPRVLHFTKDLDWANYKTDARIQALVKQFQQNIAVGTCGSGMEQHLEAGRLAVEKALQQNGLKQPAGVDPKEWPHAGAKLVVVWVGDEDDCSNPNNQGDPTKSLFFAGGNTSGPGNDVCTADETSANPKQFSVQSYADYFSGLGRPFGAAFIYSAINCRSDGSGNTICDASACNQASPPSACTTNPLASCFGKSNGTRFHNLSAALRAKSVSTLDASVCDPNFARTLQGIAQLVKPPSAQRLPSQPAATDVAVLRIESADGKTSRQCSAPAASAADAATSDWWFTDDAFCNTNGSTTPPVSTTPTSCIYINHATKHCEANPGESYIAQYLGVVPVGGCVSADACAAALGGNASDWTCTGTAASPGTCLCSSQ